MQHEWTAYQRRGSVSIPERRRTAGGCIGQARGQGRAAVTVPVLPLTLIFTV
jgi:hypothetical protein